MKLLRVEKSKSLPPFRLHLGAGFAVLFALSYFFDESGIVSALVPAVMIHELGHMAALVALGCPPRALNATLSGFSLDYSGRLEGMAEVICPAAGPAAGLAFAWLCSALGNYFESGYLLLCAGAGLVINLFNLLPALPLDGGRLLSALVSRRLPPPAAGRVMLAVGLVVSLALIAAGVYFSYIGLGAALIPAGVWVLVLQWRR